MKELLEKKITITADEFLEKVSEVSFEFSKRADEPRLAIILSLYSAELAAKLFVESELPKKEEKKKEKKEEKTTKERYFRVKYQTHDMFNCEKGDVGLLVGKKYFEDEILYTLYNKKWNGHDGAMTKYEEDRHCLHFHQAILEEVKE